MSERIGFTKELENEIGQMAIYLAGFGERGITTTIREQLDQMRTVHQMVLDNPGANGEIIEIMRAKVIVLDEIVRRARVIMQITGNDEITKIDRKMQERGLGSIFESGTKANQIFGGFFQIPQE